MQALGGDAEPRTAAEWLEAVKAAERHGELLEAVDLAERGLAEHPGELWLKHRAVLALARSGSTEEAGRRFVEFGLDRVDAEDVAALRARLAKDLAFAADGAARRRAARRSAELYADVFARTGGYYPAVNAATLEMIAGQPARAHPLAATALESVRRSGEQSYYAVATEAEAHLLLGDVTAARAALERAAVLHGGDYGSVATTRRQLRRVCDAIGIDDDVLAALAAPPVVHFCGHRIAPVGEDGRFPASAEEQVARRIAEAADGYPNAYAFGSLASGGDILWAEALLARGAELHVVLPFARDEFVHSSVADSGGGWVERCERCLQSASRISHATDDAFLGDDVLYRYGAELAMGLALLRARYLDAEARQLTLWDGGPAHGAAGTAIDVATWRRGDRPVTIVSPTDRPAADDANTTPTGPAASGRVVRALLFADVKGFSKLTDEQLPRFADHVLGAFAVVLARHGEHVQFGNTWGDALYAVLDDTGAAAECALDLQRAFAAIDMGAVGLPPHLALRMGAHVGPVFPVTDPVLRAPAFMGSHVSRTARIEPVTPPGSVYVTEAFAAALVVAGLDHLACDYVGHMPAAKDYGRLRMYRLHRQPSDSRAD